MLAMLVLASCSKDTDFVAPAFLHLDGIALKATPSITTNEGFLSTNKGVVIAPE